MLYCGAGAANATGARKALSAVKASMALRVKDMAVDEACVCVLKIKVEAVVIVVLSRWSQWPALGVVS